MTLAVIGGGAAGFFCAVNAARMHPQLSVTLFEKTGKCLGKVKVSGGGRCNVTHACSSIAELITHYPRGGSFLKKSFRHFFITDTIAWFENRAVPLKTEEDGRMFPVSNQSESVIQCLLDEASRYRVQVRMHADLVSLKRINENNASGPAGFKLVFKNGEEAHFDRVCVTVGGYQGTDRMHWLAETGHTMVPPVPSLFTFNMPKHPITELMGVTLPSVQIKINGTSWKQQGPMLITHWGLSGPAVLKLSAWAARDLAKMNYHFTISINWLPGRHETGILEELRAIRFELAAQKISNRNPFGLPARLWEFLLMQAGISTEIRWADLPAKNQQALAKLLGSYEAGVAGKTTFKEEFVTAGGVSLPEVDPNTLESRLVPGLFFAGEVLDIDGVTGGFNFQNAWTSAWIAATHAGKPAY